MGIIEFFGTLTRSNVTSNAININIKNSLKINHFMVDFNSIVHNSSQTVLRTINEIMKTYLKSISLQKPLNLTLVEKYNVKLNNNPTVIEFVKEFHEQFNENKMDEIVIRETVQQFYILLTTYLQPEELQTVLIAIDGVPSKGKLIEQKQRRYMVCERNDG